MQLGFVVNAVKTEESGYTTIRLAMAATNMGHEIWFLGLEDISYDADGQVRATARSVPKTNYKSTEVYLADLQGSKAATDRVNISEFDVLMLRYDPAQEAARRPWAPSTALLFARIAARHGVVVLNDPDGLSHALNKVYFQDFPEEVRPRTLITRERESIKSFAREQQNPIVLKPLQGSGGQNVFLVRSEDLPNLNQMIDAVSRDGYVIAQEYLPGSEEGDIRLFVMNGLPLRHKGKYAAFRRIRSGGDLRSNLHAGGSIVAAEIDDTSLQLVEMVRPKLVEDGMFLVGLDIVGDKLMEVNVFSPGGLGSAQKFEGANFARAVILALERKVQYVGYYRRSFNNTEMASL
ncbi:MAG: glutathione synthetase [Planctomycetota bacterium]